MARLDAEARAAVKALTDRCVSRSQAARILGVTEGTVRYHLARIAAGAVDGRSLQRAKAAAFAEAIAHWRESTAGEAVNLAALHEQLIAEHGYSGSLRSLQRWWSKTFAKPAIRARRRVETPPGAQAQADWAHFPGLIVGGERVDLLAFRMTLSHSRKDAIVWSRSKDMLAWLDCHTLAFRRLGGVPATVRIDNEKTAIARGAGAWGVVNSSYRRYAGVMRFHVDACAPRQPQAKGKVELKAKRAIARRAISAARRCARTFSNDPVLLRRDLSRAMLRARDALFAPRKALRGPSLSHRFASVGAQSERPQVGVKRNETRARGKRRRD
jgi:transposase